MSDPAFKVQLFRFVDVYPRLGTPEAVHLHLEEYLNQPGVKLPPGMGLALGAGGLLKGVMNKTLAGQIGAMAGRFIAGDSPQAALGVLRKAWDRRVASTVDLLGEACLSEAEAEVYHRRHMELIDVLAAEIPAWPAHAQLTTNHLGSVPAVNVSIKTSSLTPHLDAIDFDRAVERLTERLLPLLRHAAAKGVFVNFDMESRATKDLVLDAFMRCAGQVDFAAGVVLQAYLRDAEADAARLIDWSRRTNRAVTVRLVKGAYWDHEVILATERGWPIPVWTHKHESDACAERMARQLLAATPRRAGEGGTCLALGSHNARTIAATLAACEAAGLPPSAVELQMLYGMGDALKAAVVERGLRLREYVPVGDLVPGMAYLVRRLLENTSNQSWLLQGDDQHVPDDALLASPHAQPSRATRAPAPAADSSTNHVGAGDSGQASTAATSPHLAGGRAVGDPTAVREPTGVDGFRNEPFRDFADPSQRSAFARAVESVSVQQTPVSAGESDARAAVERAAAAFARWRGTPAAERAAILKRGAEIMRSRRDELAAIMVREASKPWREADADVCEAIDFCVFYAMRAPSLFAPKRLGDYLGQRDELWHEPRGVTAVISPWNFPLAICCGMTAAALVTGNPAIVKPAEQTPTIARIMCEILWQAGVPRDVLQFLSGPGETAGAALVRHPKTAVIAFTGSKTVGLEILRVAGDTLPEQRFVKKVVCEMGGKNAIIIDESADLDEAVVGVRDSAFGYAGQKCSACSRVIVLPRVRDEFVHRLVEATRLLKVAPASDPGTDVPPVIDDEASRRIWAMIDVASTEGKVVLGAGDFQITTRGRLIPPHIVTGIRAEHQTAQNEIFGPVLAVMEAADFASAIDLAMAPPYRLTGAVYSRTPSHLAIARREFRVGNLYLNRGSTGALVGRQPFGGGGMSGAGTKAGGDDYLLQFVEPRACSENTERRGFSPELIT